MKEDLYRRSLQAIEALGRSVSTPVQDLEMKELRQYLMTVYGEGIFYRKDAHGMRVEKSEGQLFRITERLFADTQKESARRREEGAATEVYPSASLEGVLAGAIKSDQRHAQRHKNLDIDNPGYGPEYH